MKYKKAFIILMAWYAVSFYANVITAVEAFRAEHQIIAAVACSRSIDN